MKEKQKGLFNECETISLNPDASENILLTGLKNNTNCVSTENGAITHRTTGSDVFDMFALGGAYRNRTDDDCITLFKNALKENKDLAMKCLFYLRDIRGGQGERRFFRVNYKWLCDEMTELARINLSYIPEYGRWDDLIYIAEGTKLEDYMLFLIKEQLVLDLQSKTPSLLGKWLPSENASAYHTKRVGNKIRKYLKMTHKQYRKVLTALREKINIVEKLMSENRWDEIEFDKIPSKAGLIYKNAFARRDILKEKYKAFAQDTTKEVNAKTLYPYDIAHQAFNCWDNDRNSIDRLMIQKYWDNLPNYYKDRQENGLAIVDTSGSMSGKPLEAAVSLGAYIAERGNGPFANHFVTFSSRPELIRFDGVDITDKFQRAARASWQMNTDLQAVFDLLLRTIKQTGAAKEEIPERLYIFSDMEFDGCLSDSWYKSTSQDDIETLLEGIAQEWWEEGYELPSIVFWNLDARQNNIPMLDGRFSYISGLSPIMIEQVLSGLDGYDLMLDKLMSKRYQIIGE